MADPIPPDDDIDEDGGYFQSVMDEGNGHPYAPGRANGRAAAANDDKPIEPLALRRFSEFTGKEVPQRRWLVEDWVPMGVVTGLYGDGGLGKTLLLQQLQISAATAQPWVGMAVEPVTSLCLYCEDSDDELHRRGQNINEGYGTSFTSLDNAAFLARLGKDNLLMTFSSRGVGELTAFYKQVVEQAMDIGAKLIGIDTASYTFGGNENDRGHVTQYVGHCLGGLARQISGAVVVTAHPSASGMSSGEGTGGSTGWSNAFRSRAFLTMPTLQEGDQRDDFARVLRRMKANYAPRSGEIPMHWRRGVLVPDAQEGQAYRRPVEEVFMALLEIVKTEGKLLSPKPRAPTYAPLLFSGRPKAERDDYRKSDFERAQTSLFNQKKLRLVEVGKASKRVTIIDRTDAPEEQK